MRSGTINGGGIRAFHAPEGYPGYWGYKPKFPLSMSRKWLITQEIGPKLPVAYWVHSRSAGDFQQVEGTLLYRGGGSDHLAGFLTHLDRVQGYGAEIL